MESVLISIALAAFFYLVLLICYKVMGKREVNQLSTVDIIINILIANIAAGGIVEEEYWLDALGGVVIIVILQILMAKLQLRYPKARDVVDGEPSLIIKNGKLDYEELRKLRIELDDLSMLLRGDGVVTPEDVQYGIIERNGKFVIFEKKLPTKLFPLPLIVSGKIKPKALESSGKTRGWLMEQLEIHQFSKLEQVDYLFLEEHKLVIYMKNEILKLTIK